MSLDGKIVTANPNFQGVYTFRADGTAVKGNGPPEGTEGLLTHAAQGGTPRGRIELQIQPGQLGNPGEVTLGGDWASVLPALRCLIAQAESGAGATAAGMPVAAGSRR